MDSIVTVRRSFFNGIRAFLNIFAEQCRGCVRRSDYNCMECDGLRARSLIRDIDNIRNAEEEKFYIENPVQHRFDIVVKAIRQANKPLTSREIRLTGITRSHKMWTLRRMCEKRILGSYVNKDGTYEYYILKDRKSRSQTKKHKKEKANG